MNPENEPRHEEAEVARLEACLLQERSASRRRGRTSAALSLALVACVSWFLFDGWRAVRQQGTEERLARSFSREMENFSPLTVEELLALSQSRSNRRRHRLTVALVLSMAGVVSFGFSEVAALALNLDAEPRAFMGRQQAEGRQPEGRLALKRPSSNRLRSSWDRRWSPPSTSCTRWTPVACASSRPRCSTWLTLPALSSPRSTASARRWSRMCCCWSPELRTRAVSETGVRSPQPLPAHPGNGKGPPEPLGSGGPHGVPRTRSTSDRPQTPQTSIRAG